MIIRFPLVFCTLCAILGIVVGYLFPSVWFIPATFIALVIATIIRQRDVLSVMMMVVFWILLGASRIYLSLQDTPSSIFGETFRTLQIKAEEKAYFLIDRLESSGLDDESLALSSALILGRKDMLSWERRHQFSEAGASHLLALSGLHMGILYGVLYLLMVRWFRHSRWNWFILPPVLLIIWGYTLIAGMSTSLIRASIMLSILTICSLDERHTSSIHVLALSALIMLMLDPGCIFDIGFQLSYLAVLFILLIYVPLSPFLVISGHSILSRINSMLLVSFSAQLGTAPLCMYYFHTFPILSAFVSLLLIPLTTLIIYGALLLLIWPSNILATGLNIIIRLEDGIVEQWIKIPGTTIHDLHPNLWSVVLIYALMFTVILRFMGRSKDIISR